MDPATRILALSLSLSVAAAADDVAEPSAALGVVTVTATLTPQPVEDVPATVSVIEAAEIERRLAQDIDDLVRYEPGVSVRNDAARFGLAGFNIRGLDGNRVLIEIDGARVSDAFSIGSFSNAGRDAVDLDTLRRVEILRGPASSLYGSDALGGVVSYVTKDPGDYLELDELGRDGYARVRAGYAGADASTFTSLTTALGTREWSTFVNATRRTGEELGNQGDDVSRNARRTAPNPQDVERDALLAKLVRDGGDAGRTRLTLEGTRGDVATEVLSAPGESQVGTSRVVTERLRGDDTQQRHRIALDHTWSGGIVDEGRAQFYVQRSEVGQRTTERRTTIAANGARAPAERERVFRFEQALTGAELVLRSDFGTGPVGHRLVYGFDAIETDTTQMRDGLQRNLLTGTTTTVVGPDAFPVRDFPNSTTRELGVFAQDEIELLDARLTVTPALRYDRFELEPEVDSVFAGDNTGIVPVSIDTSRVSPKLGASWRFDEVWSAHASYAEGFRAPPYNDANIGFTNLQFGYTAIPNPELREERSRGVEASLRYAGDGGSAALALYRNEYDDFIDSLVSLGRDPATGLQVFQSRNRDEVAIEGAEFRGTLALSTVSAALDGFTLDAALAWARGDVESEGVPLDSIDPARGVLGLGYVAPDERWNLELVLSAARRKDRVAPATTAPFVPPGHALLDLYGQYRVNDALRIDAGVFNLADRAVYAWSDVRGRPANDLAIERYTRPGRSVSVNFVYEF